MLVVASCVVAIRFSLGLFLFATAAWGHHNYCAGPILGLVAVLSAYFVAAVILLIAAFLPASLTLTLIRCSLIHPVFWLLILFAGKLWTVPCY